MCKGLCGCFEWEKVPCFCIAERSIWDQFYVIWGHKVLNGVEMAKLFVLAKRLGLIPSLAHFLFFPFNLLVFRPCRSLTSGAHWLFLNLISCRLFFVERQTCKNKCRTSLQFH